MITATKLKQLNKFTPVSIPEPKELFGRFGFTSKKGSYTGDEEVTHKSKIENLAELQKKGVE